MSFVKLTYLDNTFVYLNPLHIVSIDLSETEVTQVFLVGTADIINVKESPSDIVFLLRRH